MGPDVTWTHPFLRELLNLIPSDVKHLIDFGCGRGIVGALMRIYRKPKRLVGIDGFEPYVAFCKKHKLYDKCYVLNLDFHFVYPLTLFKDNEFDCATCIEVIEHLRKENGYLLLAEMERIAKLVIVSTPMSFNRQHAYDDNPFQIHKSLWSVNDFRQMGYEAESVPELPKTLRPFDNIRRLVFRLPKPTMLCVKNTVLQKPYCARKTRSQILARHRED